MHRHPLPKLTLPSSNLHFQLPFLNRATWLSSWRGLEPLQGSQEDFSHLTFLWWQRLEISVIFRRCTLSASLTFAGETTTGSSGAAVLATALSTAVVALQWAPEWTVLCVGNPWPRGSGGWQSLMTWHEGPHHLQEEAPTWAEFPKLLQTKIYTSKHLQLKIAQSEICWAKKNLCTSVC